jgi:arylsulfatase A-like enzyme
LGVAGNDSELPGRRQNTAGGGIWQKQGHELNCFERASLSRIKLQMTSICFNRFGRALVLLAALLEFSAPAQSSFNFTNAAPAAIPRRASIIFIQCDGLGYGDLSCYGQTKFQTSMLDILASEGIRFTNYYAGAAASSPAAATLLLGQDSNHLKQRADVDVPLAANETTVAQFLKNSGYHTGYIGEWNLGDENSSGAPWKKGFDEFMGYFDRADAANFYANYVYRYVPRRLRNATGSEVPEYNGREMLYYNSIGQRGTYIPDLYAKAAVNFVKINQPDQFNHYRPFFLLLDFKIPAQKIEVPTDAPFSGESWPQPEKNKAALISRIDDYVGQLEEQLQKSGMTNNVVIFFSSVGLPKKGDGADPQFFHSVLATNDLRAPMIVRWRGKIPAGQVSGLKWSPHDFLPTAAEIGYAQTPTNITGSSVLPALTGRVQTIVPAKN